MRGSYERNAADSSVQLLSVTSTIKYLIIWVFNRDLSDQNDEEEKQRGIMLFARCFSHDGVMVAGHEGSFWDWRKTIVAPADFGTAFLKISEAK